MKGLLFVLLLSGCDSITGCDNVTKTVEVVYTDAFYQTDLAILQGFRDQGYDCQSVAIRNAFGAAIGDRYTCTKCS